MYYCYITDAAYRSEWSRFIFRFSLGELWSRIDFSSTLSVDDTMKTFDFITARCCCFCRVPIWWTRLGRVFPLRSLPDGFAEDLNGSRPRQALKWKLIKEEKKERNEQQQEREMQTLR